VVEGSELQSVSWKLCPIYTILDYFRTHKVMSGARGGAVERHSLPSSSKYSENPHNQLVTLLNPLLGPGFLAGGLDLRKGEASTSPPLHELRPRIAPSSVSYQPSCSL
jgi:hypothetical protein